MNPFDPSLNPEQAHEMIMQMDAGQLKKLALEINHRANDLREDYKLIEQQNAGLNPALDSELDRIHDKIQQIFSIDLSAINELED